MFGTLQGRLPKELSLFGIRDIEAANRYIREVYLPLHNDQFAVPPQIPESAFVAVDAASLVDILCIEQDRVVARDNTVAYQGRTLQLRKARPAPLRQGQRQGAGISRRYACRVPRPGDAGALQRARRRDRGSPNQPKRDTVLAAVKAWPGEGGIRGRHTATAILDGGCARRHWPRAVGTKKRPSDRTKKLTKRKKKEAEVASISA